MSPRIPAPLGQLSDLPVDVVAPLRALPALVEHTDEMRRNTAVLGALGYLDESVTSLHTADEPLGRVADRLSCGSRRD